MSLATVDCYSADSHTSEDTLRAKSKSRPAQRANSMCRRKLTSFERSTDFSGIQDVSIRRSSSVVIQNLGKRDIK